MIIGEGLKLSLSIFSVLLLSCVVAHLLISVGAGNWLEVALRLHAGESSPMTSNFLSLVDD